MNDNLPNDPSFNQDANTFSPSPEVPATPIAAKPEAVETLSPEVGVEQQPSVEVPVPPSAPEPQEEPVVPQAQPEVPQETPPRNVVDKRDHDSGDNKVETSHKVTAEADQEEAEFIDNVDEVHSIA